jgi:hypothetical protein
VARRATLALGGWHGAARAADSVLGSGTLGSGMLGGARGNGVLGGSALGSDTLGDARGDSMLGSLAVVWTALPPPLGAAVARWGGGAALSTRTARAAATGLAGGVTGAAWADPSAAAAG